MCSATSGTLYLVGCVISLPHGFSVCLLDLNGCVYIEGCLWAVAIWISLNEETHSGMKGFLAMHAADGENRMPSYPASA